MENYIVKQSLKKSSGSSRHDDLSALKELEGFLMLRKKEAEEGLITTSAQDIFIEVIK